MSRITPCPPASPTSRTAFVALVSRKPAQRSSTSALNGPSQRIALIVCHDKNESWHRGNDGKDHGMVDSTIVATQMVLALTSLGLASCYVCSFKEKLAREILGLSDNLSVDIMLPIGYPKEVLPHNKRKDLESIVIYK